MAQPRPSLYPTRSSAGALLGQQLASRGYQSCILLGITPEGVEIAAHAAKAMGAQFDVIVASFIKLGTNLAPIGAMAESAPAEMDPDFQPGMNLLEKLQAAIDESRSEEHTSELQSQSNLVCRLLLEKKKNKEKKKQH